MKATIWVYAALAMFVATSLSATKPNDNAASKNPKWVDELIAKYLAEPVANPPRMIWQFKYKEQVVYYVPPVCCDQFSELYDADGKLLGAPDGGFTGRGDGKFRDFFELRSNEKLIWKDPRHK